MQNKKYDAFDKEEAFKKECQPLLDELVLKCSLLKIPFFWSACIKNNELDSTYISDAVATGSRKITLKEDKIAKYMAVLNGFDVVPHRELLEINMDELSGIEEE